MDFVGGQVAGVGQFQREDELVVDVVDSHDGAELVVFVFIGYIVIGYGHGRLVREVPDWRRLMGGIYGRAALAPPQAYDSEQPLLAGGFLADVAEHSASSGVRDIYNSPVAFVEHNSSRAVLERNFVIVYDNLKGRFVHGFPFEGGYIVDE
jgi:hypothetical protein